MMFRAFVRFPLSCHVVVDADEACTFLGTVRMFTIPNWFSTSYRKDERAMRPIHGCPENCREYLSTPTATFAEIFNGRSILCMCVQNLKFVALPIPEIIGGTQKICQSSPWKGLDTPTLPFLTNF